AARRTPARGGSMAVHTLGIDRPPTVTRQHTDALGPRFHRQRHWPCAVAHAQHWGPPGDAPGGPQCFKPTLSWMTDPLRPRPLRMEPDERDALGRPTVRIQRGFPSP